ncbi:MAG: AraC family transcriptional regulator [Zunongwangia sp.]|uniref:HTH domain-containing protein n=2 Tax=Zunongwangia profunda TaxID=398743 RepID=D5BBP3_ZUNPS|nr:AraC family transcriptional regulator [Zunongwangia profunda]ADF50477.1 HTH domain-containing protein [Zunongwangia profunda SM-A87]MAC63344.1 AraC family transcriptional regulator [Flavobacteriaceae bacterium]MAO37080.1 AraC family transcriptional regulator [Zunongwangia sp.]MAS70610.1 AraC family transcriptional regulator [Zunongwangia sp.]|tara:strand:- start:2104 stop:3000 length:897 start_codon:yes stop_codon:yes gene_type:complete
MEEVKNIAVGITEETKVEDGFYIFKFQNETSDKQIVEREVDVSFIQFHFNVKGESKFLFNRGRYELPLAEEKSLILYNPQLNLPLNLVLGPKSWLISLVISIKKFHALFSEEANYISFLSTENKDKKYYKDSPISPSMAIALNQVMNFNLTPTIKNLYFKAKAYELLSLYFNRAEDANIEQCPFLSDEENILKIRRAKDIVIARMAEPPSLQELSDEINLSLKKLKEGFKQIYGDSVYSFLFDYKMEYARKLLDSGEYNVNEVGLKVGYSTASHFIAAFKKKFGTTPKKYLMSLPATH